MAANRHLLFELGCEELPPKSLKKLSQSLLDNILGGLNDAGLGYRQARAFATPRRLAVLVHNLEPIQSDKTIEKRGPALQAAFDPDGTPSKAATGFAASCGATVDKLGRVVTEKGEWLAFTQAVKGRTTLELIPDIVRKSLNHLPIAKRMRWGNSEHEFARPAHWAVLMYGRETIETDILGLRSGNASRGHRFHCASPIILDSPDTYTEILYEKGMVIADFDQRMSMIRDAAQQEAAKISGIAHIEDELLEEVAALNEWPVPIVGHFDARFLELPMEVLITTMQANQKYFPVKNPHGGLLPHFITFSNIASTNPLTVQQGNERVVLPRLVDAEFFWKQDRKQSLAERIPSLANIVFQKDLGTLADKTERVSALAAYIAETLHADTEKTKRAALLAKTDLLTNMVGEFANLQGIMGRYYALADREAPEIATALEEQYFPKQSGGPTPKSLTGQILAVAEKMDTLCGIFSVGLVPSGDKDPYALRRAAIGILRTLIENGIDLNLLALLDTSLAQFSHTFDQAAVRTQIIEFIFDRLRGYCLDQGYSPDEYEAVLAVKPTSPPDFLLRIRAVQNFRGMPEAESLAAANKRIMNILKKADEALPDNIGALVEPEEKNLLKEAEEAKADILPLLAVQNYPLALTRLAQLRKSVDSFFDHVMVNTDDHDLRRNRMALLAMLSALFLKIADISKLQS